MTFGRLFFARSCFFLGSDVHLHDWHIISPQSPTYLKCPHQTGLGGGNESRKQRTHKCYTDTLYQTSSLISSCRPLVFSMCLCMLPKTNRHDQMMPKLSNCYVGTQSEGKHIGATNCAGLILRLLVPQSSSKPCRKETTPHFPNLHRMVNNLHEGLCREFVSNACKTHLGLIWLNDTLVVQRITLYAIRYELLNLFKQRQLSFWVTLYGMPFSIIMFFWSPLISHVHHWLFPCSHTW